MNRVITVMIPSRANPEALMATLLNLPSTAQRPELVEAIVRLDLDDGRSLREMVKLTAYRAILPKLQIIIGEPLGYARIHDYYEECYRLSSGGLLLAYNDDMTMQTTGWDEAYRMALEKLPFGVASATVNEGNGTNYDWAMPMVRRDLCERIGRFCAGTETCDRIFDAYARLSGAGIKAPVVMKHDWHAPVPGSERERTYGYACNHWAEMTTRWEAAARQMMKAIAA